MSYTIDQIRTAIADAAESWASRVQKDFDSGQEATPDKIEEMVRAAGAGWDLGPDGEYTHEGELEQCGYLLGAAMNDVGDHLESDRCVDVRPVDGVVPECIGSTARLYYRERWSKAGVPEPIHPSPTQIQRGDVPIKGSSPPGDHITIALGPPDEDGYIPTVEANAQDVTFADGTTGEGLGTRTRHISKICIVHRPRIDYFTGDAL